MRLALVALAPLAVCVIVQSAGMLLLIRWLSRVRHVLESPSVYRRVGLLLRLFGDVILGPGWRVLAGIEGLTGLLLVGWWMAFIFAVVNRMYEHWRQVHGVS
jgi:hypothetical protein